VSEHQFVISIKDGIVSMPLEMHKAMDMPRCIIIRQESRTNLWIVKIDSPFRYRLKRPISFIAHVLMGKPINKERILWVKNIKDDYAEYSSISNEFIGNYHIVNYHPYYYLMAIGQSNEEVSVEKFWENINSYHEHLDPAIQDCDARRVSEWLSRDIMKPMHARSFLELGCGSGRNLLFISMNIPDAEISGIDINPKAIEIARSNISSQAKSIRIGSIYDTKQFKDNSIDIVFTSGVLMHVPHYKVHGVVKEMYRIARLAVINFELHGPSHAFDYHRYPRNYEKLYASIFENSQISYEIFPKGDYRTAGTYSFNHALLVLKKELIITE